MEQDSATPGKTEIPPKTESGPPLTLTAKAIEKIKLFASQKEENRGKSFRIYVQGGGCSGYKYGFTFDTKRDGDLSFQAGGFEILVDTKSLVLLKGCQLDFVDAMTGAGFSVKNPNATGGCGCGESFQA